MEESSVNIKLESITEVDISYLILVAEKVELNILKIIWLCIVFIEIVDK